MIKFIGLRSSHVNRMKDENDTSKAIAKETKNPVEEREGVIELAKNARKSFFSIFSFIRGKNKAIKSNDIKPSLNKLNDTDKEYKEFFSCFYDVKAEKNGIITYSYTDTMQQTSEFYFKIAKEFAGKIGDEPKCDGGKDNWAGINTIAYRLALSFAEMKSCQEGKCKMEDIIGSRINNPPPEVTNNKEYIKEQQKKLNIAKNLHLFKSSNIELPKLEDGKKYTEEQLFGIRKDIDKLKSASHDTFKTFPQEYKPSPSLIKNTNFSNIIIQSKSETRELDIDQAFANKIFSFLDSLKDEFESNKDNGILTFNLNPVLKLDSSDLLEIAKYFAAKVGGEPKNNNNGVGINTFFSRVATHLLEEKLVKENKADQVDIYSARIKQPPIELTKTQRKEYTIHVKAKLAAAASAADLAEGQRIIRDNFKDFDIDSYDENLFKNLLLKFEIDKDIDDKLISINSADIVKVKAFLEKGNSELSKTLREYILNHPDNPFDNSLDDLKKSSAIGVLTKDGAQYKHDLKTCNLAFNFLQGKLPTDVQAILTDFQKSRDQSLESIDRETENQDKTFQSALIKGLNDGKEYLKSPLTKINLYETVTSLQVGLVSFFGLETPNFRKPNTDPKETKIENLRNAIKNEADSGGSTRL